MAALDFGMALARGLVAPQKELQAEVKKLAGDSFRTDEWWNKQLDRQIKAGFTETSRVAPNTFQHRNAFNQKMVTQKGYDSATPVYEEYYQRKGRGGRGPEKLPINAPDVDRRFYTIQKKLIGYDATKTRGLNEAELKSIENQSKKNTQRIKSESDKKSSSKKRLSRGTGGLLSKAIMPGSGGMSTGLAELGKGGLGFDMALLNKGTTLG